MSAEVPVLWSMTLTQNAVVNRMQRLSSATISRVARALISHGFRSAQAVEGLGGVRLLRALFTPGRDRDRAVARVLTVRLPSELAESIAGWHGRVWSKRGRVGTAARWLLVYGAQLLDQMSDEAMIQLIGEHCEKEKLAGIGPGRPRSR